jgi:hypothetical protein
VTDGEAVWDSPYPSPGVLRAALEAFGEDVSYAVAMLRTASSILAKRQVWALRVELRGEEERARGECSAGVEFFCENRSPCGTGSQCKYARGDLVLLDIPTYQGGTARPQVSLYDSYAIESAVRPLQELRDQER